MSDLVAALQALRSTSEALPNRALRIPMLNEDPPAADPTNLWFLTDGRMRWRKPVVVNGVVTGFVVMQAYVYESRGPVSTTPIDTPPPPLTERATITFSAGVADSWRTYRADGTLRNSPVTYAWTHYIPADDLYLRKTLSYTQATAQPPTSWVSSIVSRVVEDVIPASQSRTVTVGPPWQYRFGFWPAGVWENDNSFPMRYSHPYTTATRAQMQMQVFQKMSGALPPGVAGKQVAAAWLTLPAAPGPAVALGGGFIGAWPGSFTSRPGAYLALTGTLRAGRQQVSRVLGQMFANGTLNGLWWSPVTNTNVLFTPPTACWLELEYVA